ncbi:MAG: ATP-binding cassette domain-containing protein [Lachnospiraceae bacterium]|nr:ATP-binding cassette domain-containing protein [Lachnospiraceae bacterium]
MIIKDLSFSYGDKKIFDNFSIEIPDEGITALSGPSGCGKTTLLRLIAGLESPDMPEPEKSEAAEKFRALEKSEATEKSQALEKFRAQEKSKAPTKSETAEKSQTSDGSKKAAAMREAAGIIIKNGVRLTPDKVAFMFQEDRLIPGTGAKKQLEIAVPGCDVRRWLKAAELENEENTVPEQLSGGMKRRLALVRCLAYGLDRELILLDEPFTGVDPERIARLVEMIRSLNKTIIVTGHTEETMGLADRIVEIRQPGQRS